MRRLFPLVLILASSVALASTADQRTQFTTLLAAAQSGQLQAHSQNLRQLQDYALYPYLIAAKLTWQMQHNPDPALDKRIARFIDSHSGSPRANALRKHWLNNLAKRKRWTTLLDYVHKSDGAHIQCERVHARIATGHGKSVVKDALALWRVGHSQSKACNPVFAWLDATDRLTAKVIMHRAKLAAIAKNAHLTSYLAGKLPASQRDTVKYWAALLQTPEDLYFVQTLDADVAVTVFKRLALMDPQGAAVLIPKLAKQIHLDADHLYQMRRYVALLFAQEHKPDALELFKQLDRKRMDDYTRGWGIRAALYQGRWKTALQWLKALPEKQAGEQRWRYWRARALQQTGHKNTAHAVFASLAGNRSFFGYLAADQLGNKYNLNVRPLSPANKQLAKLRSKPQLQRAHELLAVGDMRNWARAEWRAGTQDLSGTQLQQAALLADDWGWHYEAIVTLAKSGYWDDLSIRYPLNYAGLAKQQAKADNLNPALVLSVIRTESLFRQNAVSSARAYGLMQLLPATARLVASKHKLPRPSLADLKTPAINIQLGSAYVRHLLDRFNGNVVLALAAYNAGPVKVDSWLPDRQMPADVWIENIPYTETRNYVRRALTHLVAFEYRLDGKTRSLARSMPPVPGPAAFADAP